MVQQKGAAQEKDIILGSLTYMASNLRLEDVAGLDDFLEKLSLKIDNYDEKKIPSMAIDCAFRCLIELIERQASELVHFSESDLLILKPFVEYVEERQLVERHQFVQD